MKKRKNNLKAFSLVEIIVVLLIISMGLGSVITLIAQNISSQRFNERSIIAYQLAQEGIELIRKVRDTNWKAGNSWDENLAPGTYYMDYQDSVPHSTASLVSTPLSINGTGFYVHDAVDAPTDFSRLIVINNFGLDKIQVISQVDWHGNNSDKSYVLETILYDWR